jgi:hypothetical protein
MGTKGNTSWKRWEKYWNGKLWNNDENNKYWTSGLNFTKKSEQEVDFRSKCQLFAEYIPMACWFHYQVSHIGSFPPIYCGLPMNVNPTLICNPQLTN